MFVVIIFLLCSLHSKVDNLMKSRIAQKDNVRTRSCIDIQLNLSISMNHRSRWLAREKKDDDNDESKAVKSIIFSRFDLIDSDEEFLFLLSNIPIYHFEISLINFSCNGKFIYRYLGHFFFFFFCCPTYHSSRKWTITVPID